MGREAKVRSGRKKCLKRLLPRILEGRPEVYRRLGMFFLQSRQFNDRQLARIFLRKAMNRGDERSYLIYHSLFSRRKKIIDDYSYLEIYKDYLCESSESRRRLLRKYLKLGTRQQKRIISSRKRFS